MALKFMVLRHEKLQLLCVLRGALQMPSVKLLTATVCHICGHFLNSWAAPCYITKAVSISHVIFTIENCESDHWTVGKPQLL
jgi:hypothetical protein